VSRVKGDDPPVNIRQDAVKAVGVTVAVPDSRKVPVSVAQFVMVWLM
jgi:hypothetical protein